MKTAKFPIIYHILFMSLSILVIVAGYFYYQGEKQAIKKIKSNELEAITSLKVFRISQWLESKKDEATAIFENPFTNEELVNFTINSSTGEDRNRILEWISDLAKIYEYNDIILTGIDGRLLLSNNPEKKELSSEIENQLPKVRRTGKVQLGPLHRDERNFLHLDVIIPLTRKEKFYGALVETVEKVHFLEFLFSFLHR